LEEALVMAHHNGDASYLAELYRIKGELVLKQSNGHGLSTATASGKVSIDADLSIAAQAEACFDRAIKIAQLQKSKSWELRASISLARLYQTQGKREEARTLLSRIYDWFTEGFDTNHMREAKALLDELS
jgi:hypothetical protein